MGGKISLKAENKLKTIQSNAQKHQENYAANQTHNETN